MNARCLASLTAATALICAGPIAGTLTANAAEANAASAGGEASADATALAAKLLEKQREGDTYIRMRMETSGGAAGKSAIQVQIKSRATRGGSEVVYQILWPKERKGEAVLLKQSGSGTLSGYIFTPGGKPRALSGEEIRGPLFGTAVAGEDVVGSWLAWDKQTGLGTQTVERVPCVGVESRPGKGDASSYSVVRTWIDPRRVVPMRIEKLGSSGKPVRQYTATRVVNDDQGQPVPASFTVQGPGGVTTDLNGGKIQHGMNFADAEFTPEGITKTEIPRGAPDGDR